MLCPNEDAMMQIQNIKIVSELMCVTSKSAMWCCVQIKTTCSAEHFQLPTSPLGQYCVLSPAYLQRSREVRCTYPKNMQNSTLDNATKYQIQNVKRALNVMKRPNPSGHCMPHGVMNFGVQAHASHASECSDLLRASNFEHVNRTV